MIPAGYNLNIYRGDTNRWQIKLWADKDKTQRADLTGVTAEATLRDKARGNFALPLDCIFTGVNIIEMVLTLGQNRNLPTRGVWDLKLTYPSGDVATVLIGSYSAMQAPSSLKLTRKLAAVK
jgi:hypothetical protein